MDLDRHETYSMDLRGRRVLPFARLAASEFRTVRHAFEVRLGLILGQQGRCSLAAMDGGGGRRSSPDTPMTNISHIGDWLDVLTPEERDVFALDIQDPEMPIEPSHRKPLTPRRYRRQRYYKCEIMERWHGGEWYYAKWHDVLELAHQKLRARMERAGVLG